MERMDETTKTKLATSLTAESNELLPYLPYLLQDLWELGSVPSHMIDLVRRHLAPTPGFSVLDLGCGKGAVSVAFAKEFGARVTGVDAIPEFADYAKGKAKEWNVERLCTFHTDDVNAFAERTGERGRYDLAILGAVGDILGTPRESLGKLRKLLKPKGFVLIDDAYRQDDVENEDIRYHGGDYLTERDWLEIFEEQGATVLESFKVPPSDMDAVNQANNEAIARRARELCEKYPDKRSLFESYVRSQLNECLDLDENLVGVLWLLSCGNRETERA